MSPRGSLAPTVFTPRQRAVLQQMADHPHAHEGEIVAEGREVWLGDDRISHQTLKALLRWMCVRDISLHGDTPMRYYVINSTGYAMLQDEAGTIRRLESLLRKARRIGDAAARRELRSLR